MNDIEYVLHTLRHDDVTTCGLRPGACMYWHRIGTPAPVREWLKPCARCATVTVWSPSSEALLRTLPVKVRAKVERHVRGFRGDLGGGS